LDHGELETLITNIGAEVLGYEEFKELYHRRWGIETKYQVNVNHAIGVFKAV
jgi:hypothetical protein